MKNTELNKLSERDKQVLRKLVKWKCEVCGKYEDEVGILEVHRIKRGNIGGEYTLRNIKMVCMECHRLLHYNEPGING